MTVIGGSAAVNGYAYADAIFGEKLADLLVQQDAISMYPQIKVAYIIQCAVKGRYDPPQPSGSREQWLTAMEHYLDAAEIVLDSVFGDAMCRL